ncbi:MAG: SpoIIE family protein phosphatase [Bacteroidales bacterium]|nr:SpoIIE family protein phosphatase [Bacteroidales bacterium]
MFRKFSSQLFFAFLGISLLCLVLAYSNLQQSKTKEQADQATNQVHQIEMNVLEQAKSVNNFFTFDICNKDFFESKHSTYLEKRKIENNQFATLSTELLKSKIINRTNVETHIHNLLKLSDSLNAYIDTTSALIHQRGFKDYGIEGKMRDHAHYLEKINCIAIGQLLMLRRHEKDYIIRNEQKYIDKFNQLITELIQDKRYASCKHELLAYKELFNQMVEVDRKIGIRNNSALRLKLENTINAMMSETRQIAFQYNTLRAQIYTRIRITSSLILGVIMVMGICLSIILSRVVTKRIALLSESISNFVSSGFANAQTLGIPSKNDEIGLLVKDFEAMRTEICNQIQYLEHTVEDRTEEIRAQKEHIVKQNQKIMDSIRYAQNIQEAILPTTIALNESFPEHFIFFQPKDIVSGDFYWHKKIDNSRYNISILAVADCTGHGVPGGLMSMLGIASLSDIVLKESVQSATDVLNELRTKITETLSTQINGRLLKDGMDIALAIIDHRNGKLQFAGAHRPLYLVRNGAMIKIKGDSMPIGRGYTDANFTLHEIAIDKNDTFYLCTDGFVDQHNKELNKKYLEVNYRKLLVQLAALPIDQQKETLANEFERWKGEAEQTDDVLVVGIRI